MTSPARPITALLAALITTVIAAALGAPGTASARPREGSAPAASPLTTQDANAWLDGLVPGLIDAHEQAGGVVVAVVKGGKVVATRGYGAADRDALTRGATPLDAQRHLVRIGSISKTLTATAVLQLVEAGRLDLDADVRGYLDFPLELPRGPVTLRHLLSHTAGFEDRLAHLGAPTAQQMRSLREVVALDPPRQVRAPGTTPAYSNYSNDLAGYIVQKVTGVPYEEYLATRVLRPLGMTSSTAAQPLPAALAARMATGFTQRGETAGGFEFINSRPAGAVTASAADMARYMNALLGHGGQNAITPGIRQAFLAAAPMPGLEALSPAGYVSLSFLHTRLGDHTVLGHDGDTGHFHSNVSLVPDQDTGIFVSATGAAKGDLRADIADAFLRRYVSPAPRAWPDRPEGGAQRAAAVAGVWSLARRSESTFAKAIGTDVRIAAAEHGDLQVAGGTWREVAPWVWEDERGVLRLAARRGPDGTVDAVTLSGYVAATRGGLLATNERLAILGLCLGVLLVATLTSLVVALRRRRSGRPDAEGPRGSRLRRVAAGVGPWAPVALLLAVGTVVGIFWPLLTNPMTQQLWTPGLRIAQVLLVAGALGTLAILTRVATRFRSRRWGAALGWLVTAAACIVVLAIAVTGGLLLPDATY